MAQEAIPQASDDRLRRAFEDGYAAAARGEEAAPGCTTTAEGRAFLSGYVEGARARGTAAAARDAGG
jgi:ribosome modulation factor